MIYTRFGSEVKLTTAMSASGMIGIRRVADEQERTVHVSELVADEGIKEIERESRGMAEAQD